MGRVVFLPEGSQTLVHIDLLLLWLLLQSLCVSWCVTKKKTPQKNPQANKEISTATTQRRDGLNVLEYQCEKEPWQLSQHSRLFLLNVP